MVGQLRMTTATASTVPVASNAAARDVKQHPSPPAASASRAGGRGDAPRLEAAASGKQSRQANNAVAAGNATVGSLKAGQQQLRGARRPRRQSSMSADAGLLVNGDSGAQNNGFLDGVDQLSAFAAVAAAAAEHEEAETDDEQPPLPQLVISTSIKKAPTTKVVLAGAPAQQAGGADVGNSTAIVGRGFSAFENAASGSPQGTDYSGSQGKLGQAVSLRRRHSAESNGSGSGSGRSGDSPLPPGNSSRPIKKRRVDGSGSGEGGDRSHTASPAARPTKLYPAASSGAAGTSAGNAALEHSRAPSGKGTVKFFSGDSVGEHHTTRIVLAGGNQPPGSIPGSKLQRASSNAAADHHQQQQHEGGPGAALDDAGGGGGSGGTTEQVVQAMLLLQRMSSVPPAAPTPTAKAEPPPPLQLGSRGSFTVETGASAFRPVKPTAVPATTSPSSCLPLPVPLIVTPSGGASLAAPAAAAAPPTASAAGVQAQQQQHQAGASSSLNMSLLAQFVNVQHAAAAAAASGNTEAMAAAATQLAQLQAMQLMMAGFAHPSTGASLTRNGSATAAVLAAARGAPSGTGEPAPAGGAGRGQGEAGKPNGELAAEGHTHGDVRVKRERRASGSSVDLPAGASGAGGSNGSAATAAAAGAAAPKGSAETVVTRVAERTLLGEVGPAIVQDYGTTVWSGKVKHRHRDSTVDLFCMTCLLPDKLAEQFPPTLFVSDLVSRASMRLGPYYSVKCRVDFLTEVQQQKLDRLASMGLVADCRLQHCRLVLVPTHEAPTRGRPAELAVKGYLVAT